MSRAGRGEPRPPHDLIGAWSDTADPNNRILSRPVSVPSARSGEHGKNGARHAKRIDTRRPRAGLLRVDTHADSHWLCVLDWRGRRGLSRRFPADAAGYEALAGAIAAAGEPACVAMEGRRPTGRASPGTSRRLGCPCARRSPGEDAEEAPGAGEVRRGGRGEGRPRGDVRLKARDPQEPGRVGRRGALHARGALRGGEGADLGDQHREVAAHHRAGGAQVEVPRDGGAEADGGAPSVRAEGALGAALGALADLWAAARDAALDMERAIEASRRRTAPRCWRCTGAGP